MKTSIYEHYPLYRLLFGGSQILKEYEMRTEALQLLDFRKKSLNYLELGSGNSEHKEPLARYAKNFGFKVNYTGCDLYAPQAEVREDFLVWKPHRPYDVASLPFYGIETMFGSVKNPEQQLAAFLDHAPNLARSLILSFNDYKNTDKMVGPAFEETVLHPVVHADFFEWMNMVPDWDMGVQVVYEGRRKQGSNQVTYTNFEVLYFEDFEARKDGYTWKKKIDCELSLYYWTHQQIMEAVKGRGEIRCYHTPQFWSPDAFYDSHPMTLVPSTKPFNRLTLEFK